MKRLLLVLSLVLVSSSFVPGCRLLGPALGLGLRVGAVAAVTALHVATWYAITRPVVVYTEPSAPAGYCEVPPGSQVYVIARSPDGYWVRIRTQDGREGWVRSDALQGSQPYNQ